MRWSDGQPFTADDILFFVNDLMPDKQFFASPPSQYVVNGKPMRAEKTDDYTVKLIPGGPSLQFPALLATLWVSTRCSTPNTTASSSCRSTIRTSPLC
jgi:peptide/nickel transport system substrate-binding protein